MAQVAIPRPLSTWSKYFPKLVHVVFAVGEVALVYVYLWLVFALSVPFHQGCVPIPSSVTALLNTTKIVDSFI